MANCRADWPLAPIRKSQNSDTTSSSIPTFLTSWVEASVDQGSDEEQLRPMVGEDLHVGIHIKDGDPGRSSLFSLLLMLDERNAKGSLSPGFEEN
jgi:hypothetical protein